MDRYQRNMDLLQENRPKLYDLYREAMENMDRRYPCDEISIQTAKDGNPVLYVSRDGNSVRLNSPYRPLQEAERWASQFSGDNILVNAMLFGLGNGMFAQALLRKLQKDAKLFLCEPNLDIFHTAMQEIDLEEIITDPRVLLCFEDINPGEFYDLLRENTHWTNLDTQIVCHHTGYEVLFPEAYRDFLVSIKKTDGMAQVNKDTQAHFAKKVVPNIIKNMIFLRDGRLISDYMDVIPKDIPAIIVAAGPSLDRNIEELKRAKGRSFIIAVDTAMRHLVKHEIMPDAMVTLDAKKPLEYMNIEEIRDIPLFCILESRHEIMEYHTGIKIWFQGGSFLDKLIKPYGKEFLPYQPGGSVATAAFAICAALEFEKIVFVGQDLAYQGDVTHAGGAVSHVLNEEHGIKMIDGIDGQPVKSRHDWIIYLDWFEEAIQVIKDRTEVIDATEGGAMIHGSEIMTLAEVIDRYCSKEIDMSSIMQGVPPMFTPEEYVLVSKELHGYAEQLKDMERDAKKASENCEEALQLLKKNTGHKKQDKLHKKVLNAVSRISEYMVYEIVDIYISSLSNKYLSGVFVVSDDSHQDAISMYYSSQMIFQGIVDAIQEVSPVLEEMLDQLP